MKWLLACVVVLLCIPSVHADERILSFHSDIYVNADGSMLVNENIRVRAEGVNIRRGIYRDFPTQYRDRFGNRYQVDFNIVDVQRDGMPEYYFTEARLNGVRAYMGRENIFLDSGEYTYTFSYRTNRQLGYFDSYDQLYWNVTGNDWQFEIDQASARVYLPGSVPRNDVQTQAYTGVAGSTEQAYRENRISGGSAYMATTRMLGSGEGFTIVIDWPKGYVHEPTFSEELNYFYNDNRHIIIAAVGLFLVALYYLLTWSRVGKDPEPGVVFTHYEAPDNFSPASLHYIEEMGYDNKCFAAALINLAVKGFLKISDEEGEYRITKTGNDVRMAAGERALAKHLFGAEKSIQLKQKNHRILKKTLQAHEASLSRDYEKKYFITNAAYFFLGLVLSVAVLVLSFIMMPRSAETFGAVFIIVWLTGWSFGVFTLISSAWQAWRRANGVFTVIAAIYVSIFAGVFAGIEVFAIYSFSAVMNWSMSILVLLAAGINWLFYELLKTPTRAGRKLLDKVAGFRNYLDVAEKQELEVRSPEGRVPELFEKYLPYALALGVEQSWADKFADVMGRVSSAGKDSYHPIWYSGRAWDHTRIGNFSSSLGSNLSSAISSASRAPGSSSGSGGGGSSGGGGGGGGGGGW
jgi:uncharacterized membrane protein YgcG